MNIGARFFVFLAGAIGLFTVGHIYGGVTQGHPVNDSLASLRDGGIRLGGEAMAWLSLAEDEGVQTSDFYVKDQAIDLLDEKNLEAVVWASPKPLTIAQLPNRQEQVTELDRMTKDLLESAKLSLTEDKYVAARDALYLVTKATGIANSRLGSVLPILAGWSQASSAAVTSKSDMPVPLKYGMPVEITTSAKKFKREAFDAGLNLRDRQNVLGHRGKVLHLNLTQGLAEVSGGIGWVPIRALVGFEAWQNRRGKAPQDAQAIKRVAKQGKESHKRLRDLKKKLLIALKDKVRMGSPGYNEKRAEVMALRAAVKQTESELLGLRRRVRDAKRMRDSTPAGGGPRDLVTVVNVRPFGMHVRRGTLLVSSVFPGFPAAKAGIRTGCEILSIAGKSVDAGTWISIFQKEALPFEMRLTCGGDGGEGGRVRDGRDASSAASFKDKLKGMSTAGRGYHNGDDLVSDTVAGNPSMHNMAPRDDDLGPEDVVAREGDPFGATPDSVDGMPPEPPPPTRDPKRFVVTVLKKPFGMNIQVNVLPRIVEVLPGSPAEAAGVKKGYVLTEVNNAPVSASNWYTVIQSTHIPYTLTFDTTVPVHAGNPFFGGQEKGVGWAGGPPPREGGPGFPGPPGRLSPSERAQLRMPFPKGTYKVLKKDVTGSPFGMHIRAPQDGWPTVDAVVDNSFAAKQGVRTGDVLIEIAGLRVNSSNWFSTFQQASMPFGLRFVRRKSSTREAMRAQWKRFLPKAMALRKGGKGGKGAKQRRPPPGASEADAVEAAGQPSADGVGGPPRFQDGGMPRPPREFSEDEAVEAVGPPSAGSVVGPPRFSGVGPPRMPPVRPPSLQGLPRPPRLPTAGGLPRLPSAGGGPPGPPRPPNFGQPQRSPLPAMRPPAFEDAGESLP